MEIISKLKQEHEIFEREFIELEEIMNNAIINYSNLVHVLKKVYTLWDEHEQKEERLFEILQILEINIPFEKLSFEHKNLKPRKERLNSAILSGNNFILKESFQDLAEIISILRKHIIYEDEFLYTYPFSKEDLLRIENLF